MLSSLHNLSKSFRSGAPLSVCMALIPKGKLLTHSQINKAPFLKDFDQARKVASGISDAYEQAIVWAEIAKATFKTMKQ